MAAAPKDRQALCVALVRDGKLIHERWFAAGEPVRVGRWPRNHFVLADAAAPGRQTLFDGRRQGHALRVIHDLHGRLSIEDATPTVDELRPGGAAGFDLPPGARGRLQLHGATLLFKVVPEPLAAMNLTRTWRASLLEDEPVFHTFLTGFSAVASVVMAGLYNVQPIEMSIDGAPPTVTAAYFALPVPVVEQTLPASETPSSRARRVDDRREGERPAARTEGPRDLASETRQRSALLRLLDGRGEFTREGVLAGTDDIFERTRLSLEHVTSVEVAGLAPEVRGGQGLRPTEGSAGELVDGGGGTTTIAEDQPTGPRHRVALQEDDQSSTSTAEQQAMKAIRGYARTIGACYERALNKDPQLSGRLVLTLNVVAGRVTSAEVEENRTGDLALGDCAVGAARRWRLPAETEGEFPVPYLLTPG